MAFIDVALSTCIRSLIRVPARAHRYLLKKLCGTAGVDGKDGSSNTSRAIAQQELDGLGNVIDRRQLV